MDVTAIGEPRRGWVTIHGSIAAQHITVALSNLLLLKDAPIIQVDELRGDTQQLENNR
jgi:hypothetical protein